MKNIKQKTLETDIRILKVASCPSVSGKSKLTYHIGCTAESDIQFRIYDNTAAGFFSKEWLSLDSIQQAIDKGGSYFTSFALHPLFRGKSQNNTGFLLAVLLAEGLVKSSEKKRCYELTEVSRFMDKIKPLIDSKTSLTDDDKPPKPLKKKGSSKTTSDKESSEPDSLR